MSTMLMLLFAETWRIQKRSDSYVFVEPIEFTGNIFVLLDLSTVWPCCIVSRWGIPEIKRNFQWGVVW
jgi:hypothetical protein